MKHGQYGGSGPFQSVRLRELTRTHFISKFVRLLIHPQYSFEVESLPNHTFYQPLESGIGSDLKLPVIVWGNGGCLPW